MKTIFIVCLSIFACPKIHTISKDASIKHCTVQRLSQFPNWSSKQCCFLLSFLSGWKIFWMRCFEISLPVALVTGLTSLRIQHIGVLPWRTNKKTAVHFSWYFRCLSSIPCTFSSVLLTTALCLLVPSLESLCWFSFPALSATLFFYIHYIWLLSFLIRN